MVKYHIDSYEGFQETMDNRTWRKIIVRIHNERALIMFGHDKCNFKQYLLTKQRIWIWNDINGRTSSNHERF
jgi:hypothetical protein